MNPTLILTARPSSNIYTHQVQAQLRCVGACWGKPYIYPNLILTACHSFSRPRSAATICMHSCGAWAHAGAPSPRPHNLLAARRHTTDPLHPDSAAARQRSRRVRQERRCTPPTAATLCVRPERALAPPPCPSPRPWQRCAPAAPAHTSLRAPAPGAPAHACTGASDGLAGALQYPASPQACTANRRPCRPGGAGRRGLPPCAATRQCARRPSASCWRTNCTSLSQHHLIK